MAKSIKPFLAKMLGHGPRKGPKPFTIQTADGAEHHFHRALPWRRRLRAAIRRFLLPCLLLACATARAASVPIVEALPVRIVGTVATTGGTAANGSAAVTSTFTVITATGAAKESFLPVRLVRADGSAFYDAGAAAGVSVQRVSVDVDSTTVANPTNVVLKASQVTTLTPPAAITNFALEAGGNLATLIAKDFSTAAKQTTMQTSLTSLDGKIPALGQALAANSSPVVLTAIQQAALTPPAAITGYALEAGNLATLVAKDFATQTTLALIKAKTDNIPAQGQALAAGSTPVVLTAAQMTTLTPPAAITGFALETGGNLATIAGKDFATQTTLSALNAKVTAVNTGAVVLAAGTANVGTVNYSTIAVTGLNSTALATETTLSALNAKVTAVNTGAVTISAALPAGSALLGKVGIDQTTPGTTNRVDATIAAAQTVGLAAGVAEVGNVKNSGTFLTQSAQSGSWSQWSISQSSPAFIVTGTTFTASNPGIISGSVWSIAQSSPAFIVTGTTFTNANPGVVVLTISSMAVYSTPTMGAVTTLSTTAVVLPSLPVGLVASTGITVQDRSNEGRKNITWILDRFPSSATAEGVQMMLRSDDGAAYVSTGTYIITSGKQFVLDSATLIVQSSGTATIGAAQSAYLRMRFQILGEPTTSSPAQVFLGASASSGTTTTSFEDFPHGMTFMGDGQKKFGFFLQVPTWSASANPVISAIIHAYEY